MKLEQLTYFLETARTEHIGKASKALAISPSAISHSIAQLEEELGRELFEKKGKRIFLTSHGRLLKERAERLLREVEVIREEVAADNVELQGHYRLAASHDLCAKYLAPAWIRLQNENRKLIGELYTMRSAQVVASVISKEVDLGLCFSPVAHPDLNYREIYSGQLLLVLNSKHPLFKVPEKERLRTLSQYPAVLPKAYQGIDVCERHPMFEKFGVKAEPDCLIDSYAVAVQKVAQSDAWGFMPDFVIDANKDSLRGLKPPTGWAAPFQISVVWAKDRHLTAAMQRLMNYFEEAFSK